jgi:two-component system chemotaxis response regulator CheB
MTQQLRVLVVDDSPTARALLRGILDAEPGVTVVGEASNGEEAIAAARRLRPSLITMDMFMPVMDGLQATREIMISTPTPIMIVSSAANRKEIDLSLDATAAGALTVVAKPEGPSAPDFEERRTEFVALVRSMAQVKVVRRYGRQITPPDAILRSEPTLPSEPTAIVAIAASTGGPAALQEILAGLPRDFPLPILLVQHIAHGFVRGLADWLKAATRVDVKIARDGERLRGGTVYVAPDDRHLGVRERGIVQVSPAPAAAGFRPSGTFLFQSVAHWYRARTAAVILTGMGSDGVEGLRTVRRVGGYVIAQDEQTSVVYGMPQEAVRAGLVDAILPPGRIAECLVSLQAGAADARR